MEFLKFYDAIVMTRRKGGIPDCLPSDDISSSMRSATPEGKKKLTVTIIITNTIKAINRNNA